MLESMLTRTRPDYMESADIKWNFTKFLVAKDGTVLKRFAPTTTPEQIRDEIASLLS